MTFGTGDPMMLEDQTEAQAPATNPAEATKRSASERFFAIPSDYLSRVWGYYCHLHFQRFGWPFTPDSLPHWAKPGLMMGLLDMEAGVLVKIQRFCSGECLFAHRYGLVRGPANDR